MCIRDSITGSYTLVSEAIRLDLMPHLKVQYPAETKGQIYIDTVNKILWVGCTFIVLLFRSSAHGVGLWPCHHGDDADDNAASVRVSFPCAREESARDVYKRQTGNVYCPACLIGNCMGK